MQAARGDIQDQGQQLQAQILAYEKEARDLERMEAELLKKLQETQNNERAAFQKLESAMVDASLPTRKRVQGDDCKSFSSTSGSRLIRGAEERATSRGKELKSR